MGSLTEELFFARGVQAQNPVKNKKIHLKTEVLFMAQK